MAYEVGLTKHSIGVLTAVFKAGSTFSDLSKIISAAAALGSAFPVFSAAMLIGIFLPLSKCTQDFEVNMLKDLNGFLDRGGSNEGLVTEISNFMRDKYDWLENYCLVYDDVHGSDKHWIGGYRVSSLHRNGKCGIVFYRTKGKRPRFSNRYHEALQLVNKILCGPVGYFTNGADAKDCYSKIVARINAARIEWSGFVVISGASSSLKFKGTFSTFVVDVYNSGRKEWWGTVTYVTTARSILLLK